LTKEIPLLYNKGQTLLTIFNSLHSIKNDIWPINIHFQFCVKHEKYLNFKVTHYSYNIIQSLKRFLIAIYGHFSKITYQLSF